MDIQRNVENNVENKEKETTLNNETTGVVEHFHDVITASTRRQKLDRDREQELSMLFESIRTDPVIKKYIEEQHGKEVSIDDVMSSINISTVKFRGEEKILLGGKLIGFASFLKERNTSKKQKENLRELLSEQLGLQITAVERDREQELSEFFESIRTDPVVKKYIEKQHGKEVYIDEVMRITNITTVKFRGEERVLLGGNSIVWKHVLATRDTSKKPKENLRELLSEHLGLQITAVERDREQELSEFFEPIRTDPVIKKYIEKQQGKKVSIDNVMSILNISTKKFRGEEKILLGGKLTGWTGFIGHRNTSKKPKENLRELLSEQLGLQITAVERDTDQELSMLFEPIRTDSVIKKYIEKHYGKKVLIDDVVSILNISTTKFRGEEKILLGGKPIGWTNVLTGRNRSKKPKENLCDLLSEHLGLHIREEKRGDTLLDEHLDLVAAIGLLGVEDPLKLKEYLHLTHPELSPEDVDELIITSFKNIRSGANQKKEEEYLKYRIQLVSPEFDIDTSSPTEKTAAIVRGCAEGATHIYLSGDSNKKCRVKEDGTFEFAFPLNVGETNQFTVMAINDDTEERSSQKHFTIVQTTKKDPVENYLELLSSLKQELVTELESDPSRKEQFVGSLERLLIRKFTHKFEEGMKALQELRKKYAHSDFLVSALNQVEQRFRAVEAYTFPHLKENTGEELFFFQKYTALFIAHKIKSGKPGFILANEPGLGKTRVTHAATNGHATTIIAPNAVVAAWTKEGEKVLKSPSIEVLSNMSREKRKERLRTSKKKAYLTNVEFLQNETDEEAIALLSGNGERILVFDEGHFLKNVDSIQTKTAEKLSGKFRLLVTASPVKDSASFMNIMRQVYPKDPRFQNQKAFLKAFPNNDPKAMKLLHALMNDVMIRFRKRDVLEEYDPMIPLSEQSNKLPRKIEIGADVMGEYTLTDTQAHSFFELLTDWQSWTEKHQKYIPKNKSTREDGIWQGDRLSKKHALRYLSNDPKYIDAEEASPKHIKVKEIVERCLDEGRKVVIFCHYQSQADAYAKLFSELKPALFTGATSKQGLLKDDKGTIMLFKKLDSGRFAQDEKGFPIPDTGGEAMTAMEYETMRFQDTQDCKLMLATYKAGSVGTTFTAGKAMIFDDLPEDYMQQYQAADRIHRIDNSYKTHGDVLYFSLKSKYSATFLEKMKRVWVRKNAQLGTYEISYSEETGEEWSTAFETFFAQGTYDEVHSKNLQTQKLRFNLIMDGIATEEDFQDDLPTVID